ncbi:uncharacterized protein LOC132202015 [Neocloeon triangulifer]|uniref:uncharacterized protein LOC132202015 n=1 Tax=Neocloeon triangulifer TaxID=2078957 RepID=UPI00286F4235|nr:uncharacterized protein LOC132202015 [Neocloeon triangulifer]
MAILNLGASIIFSLVVWCNCIELKNWVSETWSWRLLIGSNVNKSHLDYTFCYQDDFEICDQFSFKHKKILERNCSCTVSLTNTSGNALSMNCTGINTMGFCPRNFKLDYKSGSKIPSTDRSTDSSSTSNQTNQSGKSSVEKNNDLGVNLLLAVAFIISLLINVAFCYGNRKRFYPQASKICSRVRAESVLINAAAPITEISPSCALYAEVNKSNNEVGANSSVSVENSIYAEVVKAKKAINTKVESDPGQPNALYAEVNKPRIDKKQLSDPEVRIGSVKNKESAGVRFEKQESKIYQEIL